MPPTQAGLRGHGGSFDEAYQSILVPTAVSWEGNWSQNGPPHLFKGLEASTAPLTLQEGSCPTAEGKCLCTSWRHSLGPLTSKTGQGQSCPFYR